MRPIPKTKKITTEAQVLARLADAQSLLREERTLDGFRCLESIPVRLMLSMEPSLRLYLELAEELGAWGDGLALTDEVRQDHPLEIRLAACEFLHSYSGYLTRHSTMANNRFQWLMTPDPDEGSKQDPEPAPETLLEDSQPSRPDLN
ncbi:MAG: hypothetical protein JWM59_1863 [Verrucomicrobiales bacterium]|nr:hypothetical protein [Verrucomicrobiales bacterium]